MMRNTYRYLYYADDGSVLHGGITNDPYRREGEHLRRYGEGHLEVVGPRVARYSALLWEDANGLQANGWEEDDGSAPWGKLALLGFGVWALWRAASNSRHTMA